MLRATLLHSSGGATSILRKRKRHRPVAGGVAGAAGSGGVARMLVNLMLTDTCFATVITVRSGYHATLQL